jgi:glycosyltransferase involved in cell wall biosynthesis
MKLAYFSPMPPSKTGIATYSSELVPALAKHFDITVFTATSAAQVPAGLKSADFATDPGVLKSIPAFNRVVYHLGNNPYFHLDILRAFLLWPDAVVLHDTVLYFLAAGAGRGGLLRELLHSDPASAFAVIDEIDHRSPGRNPLRYGAPSKYPCLMRILHAASHVIVHNQSAKQEILARGYDGPVTVVPLLHYRTEDGSREADLQAVRSRYGLSDGCVLLGVFGFIGPTKRLDKVFEALGRVVSTGQLTDVRLVVVGEGDPIGDLIREHGLERIVISTGFVDDGEFRRLLTAVDVVLNLRYPSHGESSATLVQALMYGKPCIVTDDASFSDFPDNCVIKVGHEASEVDQIAHALVRLAESHSVRERVGSEGRRFVAAHHSPAQVALNYWEALSEGGTAMHAHAFPRRMGGIFAARYLQSRVTDLLP